MFQYTREFIINEDVVLNAEKENGIVSIEGVASYKVGKDQGGMDRIMSFTRVPFKAPVIPKIDIPFTTEASADQKITIRIELYRATEASYANNLHAKMSKLFQFEIPAATSIDGAVALIESVMRCSDHKYFTVAKSGTNIRITGVEGAQRISAEKFKSTGIDVKHEAQWALTDTIARNEGEIGHGTYELLMHNNRLPVPENTGYFSPNKFEMPVPGVQYELFEFIYNSGIRNIGGSGVVGSYERSMTKHRFWVNKALIVDTDGSLGVQTSQIGKALVDIAANAVTADLGNGDATESGTPIAPYTKTRKA